MFIAIFRSLHSLNSIQCVSTTPHDDDANWNLCAIENPFCTLFEERVYFTVHILILCHADVVDIAEEVDCLWREERERENFSKMWVCAIWKFLSKNSILLQSPLNIYVVTCAIFTFYKNKIKRRWKIDPFLLPMTILVFSSLMSCIY